MRRLLKMLRNTGRGLAALSPNCREASRLQSEALDHPLAPAPKLGLRLHLLLCRTCLRYGRQLRLLHEAAPRCADPAHPYPLPGPDLSPAARERLQKALRPEPKNPPGP